MASERACGPGWRPAGPDPEPLSRIARSCGGRRHRTIGSHHNTSHTGDFCRTRLRNRPGWPGDSRDTCRASHPGNARLHGDHPHDSACADRFRHACHTRCRSDDSSTRSSHRRIALERIDASNNDLGHPCTCQRRNTPCPDSSRRKTCSTDLARPCGEACRQCAGRDTQAHQCRTSDR